MPVASFISTLEAATVTVWEEPLASLPLLGLMLNQPPPVLVVIVDDQGPVIPQLFREIVCAAGSLVPTMPIKLREPGLATMHADCTIRVTFSVTLLVPSLNVTVVL